MLNLNKNFILTIIFTYYQEITFKLLKKALLNNKGAPGYLIDGFPRSLEQAIEFENSVIKINHIK